MFKSRKPSVPGAGVLALISAAGMCSAVQAQATFVEVEPNDAKAGANAFTLAPGDMIQGFTTGNTTASPGDGTPDYFRVKTSAAAAGIYRQRLVITTTGTPAHVGGIRGLTQSSSAGINPTTDAVVQTSTANTTPARMVQWYGFGKQEEISYRVNGTASTNMDYFATLTRDPVSPTELGSFTAGMIQITTVGQGHTTNTDLWVYDSNFNAIAEYGNDDHPAPGTATTSRLTRDFAAGVYYLALSNSNLANNLAAPADDRTKSGAVLDFPDAAVNSANTTNINVSFAITDGNGTLQTGATRADPFDINWYRFTVTGAIPTGACCDVNAATCSVGSEYTCVAAGGVYKGHGTTCAAVSCERIITTALHPNTSTSAPLGAYLDLNSDTPLLVSRIDYHPTVAAGNPVQLKVYVRDGTYRGYEAYSGGVPDPANGWTLVSTFDGTSLGGHGPSADSLPLHVVLQTPFLVQPGHTRGVVIEATAGNMYFLSSSAGSKPIHDNGEMTLYSNRRRAGTGGSTSAGTFGGSLYYIDADTSVVGACCLLSGTCQSLSLASCSAQGGLFKGAGVNCGDVTCTAAGACCKPDGTCALTYEDPCVLFGGVWSGAGVQCGSVVCSQPGACCFPNDGGCQLMHSGPCATAGGTFQGPGTTCAQGACWSEPVLWNNGPLATGEVSSTGISAPFGSQWSEVQAGNSTPIGWFNHRSSVLESYTLADDFIITAPGGWQVDRVTVFGTRAGSTTGSSFSEGYVEIWNGEPGTPGASVVFGDHVNNRLIISTFANLFRSVSATTPNGLIYANELVVGTTLPPGHYWVRYYQMIIESSGINLSPSVTILGSRGPAIGNARQSIDGDWVPVVEHNNAPVVDQEMPFLIHGFILPPPTPTCYANCDGSTLNPFLNVADFTCFLQKFAAGETYANCDESTTAPVLNVADFTCFLQKFAAGCSAP